MINANELRIGNWVQLADCGFWDKPGSYDTIGWASLEDIEVHGGCIYNPVPLTPELLGKCNSNNYFKKGKHVNLDVIHEDGKFRFIGQFMEYSDVVGWITISELKYLHEYQNLFFLLNGWDIEISL